MRTSHQCPKCGTVEPLLTLDEHAGAMQPDPTQSFHDLATENATLKRQLTAAHDLIDAAGGAMAQNREAMTALQHRVNTAEDMYDRERVGREKFNRMAVRVTELEECLRLIVESLPWNKDWLDPVVESQARELLDRKADA